MLQIFLQKLPDLFTLFLGLIVEATPFVLLGVIVSVLVAIFVKEDAILKLLPKNKFVSHMILSLSGVFMPVCECGNVPVVRRLLLKGFNVSHAVTFLLAAPIVNPITIWSTYEAFKFDPKIVVIRVIGALLIANLAGWLISLKKDQASFLHAQFYQEVCEHDHKHNQATMQNVFYIFNREFVPIIKMLMLGAMFAAISQTFIPRDLITSIGSNGLLSIIAMIILAFVISICANVDAFFALAYSATFTNGSLLSFLIFGPMIDIKILTMLQTTFSNKLLIFIAALVFSSSLLVGLLVNYFY